MVVFVLSLCGTMWEKKRMRTNWWILVNTMEQNQDLFGPRMKHNETLWTWANLVTILRTVSGLAIFSISATAHNAILNIVGLLIYWVMDFLDGYLARLCNQETRLGAQMDILADRLLIAFFYLNFLAQHPDMVLSVVLFLIQFMGLDHYLSNQFMRWPILSPNYFFKVDKVVWRLNWSFVAKILNSGLVTVVLITTESPVLTLIIIIGLLAVKIYSCIRLHRLALDW
jgi:CDP-diacylglycerol--glycerol-3-phosphate 3-phosphatidyltransferase